MPSVTYKIILNVRALFVQIIDLLKISNTIAIFYLIEMLDKEIVCINALVQLFVSCLVSCVNRITNGHYTSRSYTTYMILID